MSLKRLPLFVAALICLSSTAALSTDWLANWYPGDGHVHTGYSYWDWEYIVNGSPRPSVAQMINAGYNAGLKWMMITDHQTMTNADTFLGTRIDIQAWNANPANQINGKPKVMVIPGEEVGKTPDDWLQFGHGHCLGWDMSDYVTSDGTCQNMIDAVSSGGGLAFIAHPDKSNKTDFYPWDDWNVHGYTGVEGINGGNVQAYVTRLVYPGLPGYSSLWDVDLASDLPVRISGACPLTSHVVVANSDAHTPFFSVGSGRTFLRISGDINADSLREAVVDGRCVASSGPLLVGALAYPGSGGTTTYAQIGDVAEVAQGDPITLEISWQAASKMSAIQVIGKNGATLASFSAAELPATGTAGNYSGTKSVSLKFTESSYVRLEGTAGRTWKVFANPIWIKIKAPTTASINFEGVPSDYLYYGGNRNLGNYYVGRCSEAIYFGPGVTILDANRYCCGYNSSGYPPHSGSAVAFSIDQPYADITFLHSIKAFGGWFSSMCTLYLDAYDSSGNLITSSSMPSNYGRSDYMSASSSVPNIQRVRIHDSGNSWTMDDLYYSR